MQTDRDACSATVMARARAAVWLLLGVGLLAAVAGGCGPGHPKTYPVRGKVVFDDGAPLTSGAFIAFESTPAEGLPVNARGLVRADGTFVLSTFGDADGAVAGKHRVLVRAQRAPPDASEASLDATSKPAIDPRDAISKPVIDLRFERYETSGLEFTVTEGDNEFTVVVQWPVQAADRR